MAACESHCRSKALEGKSYLDARTQNLMWWDGNNPDESSCCHNCKCADFLWTETSSDNEYFTGEKAKTLSRARHLGIEIEAERIANRNDSYVHSAWTLRSNRTPIFR